MSKYIDAEKLKELLGAKYKEFTEKAKKDCPLQYQYMADGLDIAEQFVDSLQQEQPKEICSKCIHHGKDDDYCYNPHGGMQSLINENGVYECTGFCEKEQEQPEVELEKELDAYYDSPLWDGETVSWMTYTRIARHFYELGKNARKEE